MQVSKNQVTPHELQRRNARSLIALGVMVFCMASLAYASVPLYDLFCRVTGFGGTTQVAKQAPETIISEHHVKVRFNAHINPELDWLFFPVTDAVTLAPGEQVKAVFRATNLSEEMLTGTATFNVTPQKAGTFFMKMECFCFTEQLLAPGESVDMPVVFYLDPEIASDKNTIDVDEVVLSYTFFKALQS
tara:strand:- start:363 stop:929 length:567 start_codon:yes stop_codon:yes gene_type:complete